MVATRLPARVPAALLLALATLGITVATGGVSPSLIEPDEGGHYVNALFLGDWIRAGFPSPMSWARDFYAHYPRLSIGHWPPGWYMLEAPFFALFRPSPHSAALASAFFAGLPGIAVLWALGRLGRPRLGLALALAYAMLPLTLEGARFILLDQPLALTVALAAIAWQTAAERPTWPRFLLFALLAAACPLVKGNGALIALVPPLHVALTGNWRLLRRPALWGAAALTLALVAPWYWLSFRISAEGFNYAPGAAYAALALGENARTILSNLGWAGIALALAGAAALVLPSPAPERGLARLATAVVVATLVFQSAVPASLVGRYMSPLLPWLVVLAGLGLFRLARLGGGGVLAGAALAALALVPSVRSIGELRPKPDLGAPAIAAAMAKRGGLYLVDGRSGGEGGVIAAAAFADGGRRRVWVARASQWLSTSDFMGRGYRLTVADPAGARAVLDRLGAAGTVSVLVEDRFAYPHSRLLLRATETPGYARERRAFLTGTGTTVFARRLAPVTPNAALLAGDPMSAKAGRMAGALN